MKKALPFLFSFSLLTLGFLPNGQASSLDEFFNSYGYALSPLDSKVNEGYCTFAQQKAFIGDLQSYSNISKILEIGFNAGHSAELFLKYCPSASIVSFDLNDHSYTPIGVDFLTQTFQERFQFVQGDSRKTVSQYAHNHPQDKFDLIYIDGGHSFELCFSDILNCKLMASPDCILWINDYWDNARDPVKTAVDLLEHAHVIRVLDRKHTSEAYYGDRSWIIAQYATH